jgi:prepilin-type N-terminal cleavage/methylation domain-containing protein
MRHAFTLIELMIVVAIIAVIAAIAIPQLMEKRKEQDAAATPRAVLAGTALQVEKQ